MKRLFVLLICLFPALLLAQWSSDPANNLIIAKDTGNYVLLNIRQYPKWTPRGELLINWIETGIGGCLQLFDEEGFIKWNIPNKGYNSRFRFDIDSNGDAIISYSDYSEVSYLYDELKFCKISRHGETIWSTEENALIQDSVPDYLIKHEVRLSPENDILTAYLSSTTQDKSAISVNKINSDGSLTWPDKMIERIDGGRYKIFNGENGGLIWIYLRSLVPFGTHYQMLMCFIDKNGNEIWPRDEILYSGRIVVSSTYQSKDGNCYIAFHPSKILALSNKGQHIWEPQGADVIIDEAVDEVYPIIMGITNSNEIFIHFIEKIYNDNPQHFGQLIDNEGNRLWSDSGRQFTKEGKSFDRSEWRFGNDTVFVVYPSEKISSVNDTTRLSVCIFRYDEQPDWENSIDLMDQGRPIPEHLYGLDYQVSNVCNGQIVVIWSEWTRSNKTTIYAQNIHSDGTLGKKSSSIDEFRIQEEIFLRYEPGMRMLRFNDNKSSGHIHLYNISGTPIYHGKLESEIQLPDVPPGIYILNIRTGDNVESHKLFVR